ncbi:queuosine precursor transporter [Luteibaculum oceani]|uniref:queuosine precursor transporter n=1 Tax=Luteibaculum oceani TaxID=1294296 RepID=UPI0029390458|nr:queuosine precursor transporter [Luteibaculum oceani]
MVSCNLIFQKFFFWSPFSFLPEDWGAIQEFTFEISVGILPYPITFLITDLISEIFGRKKANLVVVSGLVAALFTLLVVSVSDAVPATSWSPVNDTMFTKVFGLTGVAVGASMLAYLFAQLIDVRLFHFWKNLTGGKYLWIRNNFSTMGSQLIDTSTVLVLLCTAGAIAWDQFFNLLLSGFLFKVIVALFDTPIFYLVTFWARKHFALQLGEEISLD